jgi:hypothetical protein
VTAQHPGRDDAPEADLLEQQAPIDPSSLPDTETVSDSADTAPPAVANDVNEADRLEQLQVVADDEDDYPHDA